MIGLNLPLNGDLSMMIKLMANGSGLRSDDEIMCNYIVLRAVWACCKRAVSFGED
jgi:hypothetical protein